MAATVSAKLGYRSLLIDYLGPQAGRVAVLAALLFAGIALQLVGPLILRRFIDNAAPGPAAMPMNGLLTLAGVFVAAALLTQVSQVGATWFSEQVGWTATNRLRGDLANHCLRLDLTFHNARTPGELIERIDGDVTALAGFFSQFVLQILGSALLLAGILTLLALSDWRIGLAMAVFAVVAFLAIHRTGQVGAPRWAAERQARSELAGFLEERFGGLDDIRANGGGGHIMRLHGGISEVLNRAGRRAGQMGMVINVAVNGLYTVGLSIALIGGVILWRRHEVTAGTVYLFVQYTGMMANPLAQIGMQLQQFQSASAGLSRVRKLQAIEPKVRDGPGVAWRAAPPGVVFDHVSFGYDAKAPVLKDVSFALNPGETLGLLGRTGSGKTTLIRLLFRLYDVGEGAIRLDGQDVRAATLAQLRDRIGVVTQEVQLFEASVRENVTLFDPAIGDRRVREVLDDIGLGPWLSRQPRGLDSDLTADGLSAGEAQLLAFARVFLRDPGLVVLDEASSRLDPATDRLIERAMDKLLRPSAGGPARTAIIIAHKLATVRRADKILILDHGAVLESGERTGLAADPASQFARLLNSGIQEVLE
ncbi:MAG: ABC transporter ATP-binding protein [Caulobacterales bacterium]